MQAAAERSRASLNSLRDAVRSCVAELKQRDMTPEAVLITMKAYFKHTANSHFHVDAAHPQWALDAVGEQLSKWCIDEYFTPPPLD